jgi:hypothetical protein
MQDKKKEGPVNKNTPKRKGLIKKSGHTELKHDRISETALFESCDSTN